MTAAATHPFPRKTCNVHGSLPRGGGLGWGQQTNPAATTLIQNNINSSLLWDWNSSRAAREKIDFLPNYNLHGNPTKFQTC